MIFGEDALAGQYIVISGGIRANSLAPGIVDADMARQQWGTQPEYRARARC